MFNFFNSILNFFFPPTCGFCGEINKDFICCNCNNFISQISESSVDSYSNSNSFFNEHFYLFKYENKIRYTILQYKFLDNSYLYKTFATLFISNPQFSDFIKQYNCITCVPLNKKRFKQRGYNQSYLIAKELAKYFKIPFYPDLLVKQNNVVAQSSLNKHERFGNIQNAFKFNNYYLNLSKSCYSLLSKIQTDSSQFESLKSDSLSIAIFDDIFTTRCNR